MNPLTDFLPETKISFEQRNEAAAIYNETTYRRNETQWADYTETVIHVILTCGKGNTVSIWRLANGKTVDEAMLNQMGKDGLLTYRPCKRNMYSSPAWTRVF